MLFFLKVQLYRCFDETHIDGKVMTVMCVTVGEQTGVAAAIPGLGVSDTELSGNIPISLDAAWDQKGFPDLCLALRPFLF